MRFDPSFVSQMSIGLLSVKLVGLFIVVRTQCEPMRPHIVLVFQTLIVCLSLVRVPESRVTRGSGFLGGGEAYSGKRCKDVVFRNLGLFGQRLSAMVTKPLV